MLDDFVEGNNDAFNEQLKISKDALEIGLLANEFGADKH